MSNRPLNVLQVLPALSTGGVERGTVEVSDFIVKKGHNAFVCSSGGKMEADLARVGATHIKLPMKTKNLFKILRNTNELVDIIHNLNIDVVHARSRAPAWSAYLACRKAKVPFVTTFHGTYNFSSYLKKLYNSVMVRGDVVIAISGFIKRHIHQNYKGWLKSSESLSVIFRGTDTTLFDPEIMKTEDIQALKQHLDIDAKSKIIILPGRLTRWKGQLVMIEAMRFMKTMNVVCLLVGSDQGRKAYSKELNKKIRDYKLQDKVKLIGGEYDMPLVYALSDVVVHASTDPEGFGRVIAEAQAMGKPIVTNDLGAPKEIIIRNETGWLVPPNNAEKLASKIKFVLSFKAPQLKEIKKQARKHVLQNFTKEIMCTKVLKVYETLVNPE